MSRDLATRSGTAVEALLRRDALVVASALGAVALLSWIYLTAASLDMYGRMDGLSAWMMTATWDARYFLLIVLMWIVMMIGMMLPSAAPTILLFARTVRASAEPDRPVARTYVFAAGYLAAWVVFSVGAAALQRALAEAALLSPMMEPTSARAGGAILLAAAAYQLTPLKRRCLTHCRMPLQWLAHHWRPGVAGALRMGVSHGWYCVGCCWGLMLLLFFGGVMNLLWIAGIAAVVLLEKVAPYGLQVGRAGGVLLAAAGLRLLL